MSKRIDFAEWKALEAHAREMQQIDLRTLFEKEADRTYSH